MSTKGIIARPVGDTWAGRYHHWDAYPSGLGRALWDAYDEQFSGNIEKMQDVLLDQHPAGWSTIVLSGDTVMRSRAFDAPGYLDPGMNDTGQAICCCHGSREETAVLWTEAEHEYVYVLAPVGITILRGSRVLAFVSWHAPEPDWSALDEA